jgi:hypothetical protein
MGPVGRDPDTVLASGTFARIVCEWNTAFLRACPIWQAEWERRGETSLHAGTRGCDNRLVKLTIVTGKCLCCTFSDSKRQVDREINIGASLGALQEDASFASFQNHGKCH